MLCCIIENFEPSSSNTWREFAGDYIAAFNHVLVPIAYEFAPDLIIVSAGFDAADGVSPSPSRRLRIYFETSRVCEVQRGSLLLHPLEKLEVSR